MNCLLCKNFDKNKLNSNYDCVIGYLEQIKLHYLALKSEFDGNKTLVEDLKQQNFKLLHENSWKKRKTNSSDSSDISSPSQSIINSINKCVLADESTDILNDALNIGVDLLDDESFVVSSQPPNLPQPNSSPGRKLFQDKLNIMDTTTKSSNIENNTLATSCKQKNPKLENRDPQNVTKWISKDQSKVKSNKIYSREWNLSVIRPIKSIIENSEEMVAPPKLSSTKSLSLSSNRLRQTRLKFDEVKQEKVEPTKDADETFCGDLVESSPTVLLRVNKDCTKNFRKRYLRTKGFNENIFDSKKSDPFLSPPPVEEADNAYDIRKLIKTEPVTLKKSSLKLNIPKSKESSTNPRNESYDETMCSSSSSVLVLPSQPEDLILVDESDNEFDDNINSLDLRNVMKNRSDCSSDFLARVEEECIKKLKNEQAKKNNLKQEKITVSPPSAGTTSSSTELKENEKISVQFDCPDCQRYANFIGRNLSDEEIMKRMKECCKHKKPVRLNDTPDGFWNPEFAPTQSQPNETLFDNRFIKKK